MKTTKRKIMITEVLKVSDVVRWILFAFLVVSAYLETKAIATTGLIFLLLINLEGDIIASRHQRKAFMTMIEVIQLVWENVLRLASKTHEGEQDEQT